jgi:hypothetical protein
VETKEGRTEHRETYRKDTDGCPVCVCLCSKEGCTEHRETYTDGTLTETYLSGQPSVMVVQTSKSHKIQQSTNKTIHITSRHLRGFAIGPRPVIIYIYIYIYIYIVS